MSWWSSLWSMLFGGGSVVSAVDDGLKVAAKAEDLVHDHNERVAGEDHVVAEDNAAKAKVNADVAKAAVDTTDDAAVKLLRDGSA